MQKIWLNAYPAGIPEYINTEAYQSIIDIFNESCEKHANCEAYANFGESLCYKEVKEKSHIFAAFLQQVLGLKKGARVAIMMPNLLQYPIVLFGILQAGGIVVNVNPLYTPTELSVQLKDSGAETIIVLTHFAHTLEKALPETVIKNIILTEVGDCLSFIRGNLINLFLRYFKKAAPVFNLSAANTYTFKKIFRSSEKRIFTPVPLSGQDIAFLQYTGGTTGVAKGAIITHANMVANMMQIYVWVKDTLTEKKEIMVTPLPLYHIFSLTVNCLTFLMFGGLALLITNPRDIGGFIKTLKRYKFTIITGVNTLFNALLHHPEFASLNFDHLHITLGGGMAVQKPVVEKWKAVTGKLLSEGYGLTEASPVVTINPLNITEFKGSIGLPVPSTEISIRNDQGEEIDITDPEQVGELCIKGPQIMQGYWNAPDETKKAFTSDGWLKTGDMVKINPQGFMKIVDRKKDMILVSGFNVYPAEVEAVLAAHPGILEAGVVGEPADIVGEIVKAVIVKKDLALTAEDIIQFCRLHLTGYKIPRKIEFRKSLPKSNVGKILRRELKD